VSIKLTLSKQTQTGRIRKLVYAFFFGIASLLAAVVISFFLNSQGHLINTNAWPPEAQAILLEKPGAPISSDQWKRIRVTLNKYNAVTPMAHLFAADVRSSWYVFLISPLLALVLLRRRFSTDTIPVALAATAPSLLVLTACAFSNSPYLK